MGMAHRGRLNVLSNIVGKSHAQIFGEFEGHIDPDTVQGSGDVKYHLGTEGTYTARSGKTADLRLPPNPSHLEAVNPVVEGVARAMQDRYDRRGDEGVFPALPLLMHGDAAFAGQGVVAETLNLSQLRGLPDRRHHPRRDQQPGRVHHLAARGPLVVLRHRRRQGDPGARCCTSTVTTPRPSSGSPGWRSPTARSSTATSSSTSSATGGTATTRATTRRSPSRRCTRSSTTAGRCASSTPNAWSGAATSRSSRPRSSSRTSRRG